MLCHFILLLQLISGGDIVCYCSIFVTAIILFRLNVYLQHDGLEARSEHVIYLYIAHHIYFTSWQMYIWICFQWYFKGFNVSGKTEIQCCN